MRLSTRQLLFVSLVSLLSVPAFGFSVKAESLTLQCTETDGIYSCRTPNGTDSIQLKTLEANPATTSSSDKDEHYIGLGYQSGGHARYGFVSRIKLAGVGGRLSLSARPSVFGGYDEDKVEQVQSVFEDIKPTDDEIAPAVVEPALELPAGIELPPGVDIDNLPAEYQALAQQASNQAASTGLNPDQTSDATLKRLEENFKAGKYSQLTKDDDDVEDYVFLQVGLPLTLDYKVSDTFTLYAGGGYALGFFQQESAGLLTTGVDVYLGKNFVLNSGLNTYFYEDSTDLNYQLGLGLTF